MPAARCGADWLEFIWSSYKFAHLNRGDSWFSYRRATSGTASRAPSWPQKAGSAFSMRRIALSMWLEAAARAWRDVAAFDGLQHRGVFLAHLRGEVGPARLVGASDADGAAHELAPGSPACR